ncbi:MAG: hypothetical protein ABFD07_15175 [Methanobacterium sp.]
MNNFINITNNSTNVCTGEYFAVDKTEYEEVLKKETDEKGMISLGRSYSKKKILVFLSDSYNCIKKGSFILMSKKTWVEARQSKGKKAGAQLNVFANGTVWTYKPNMKALVFVRDDK